jgi:hypothetical protein
MRLACLSVCAVIALVLGLRSAHADSKALKPYAGKLVISPDAPPTAADEIPHYLKGNHSKDDHYELIKGPPWPFHVVAVLAKPVKEVTLVILDKADPKAAPLLSASFTLAGDRKLLLAQAEATIAANFAAHRPYVVKLVVGKKTLATAELLLRD